MHFLSVTRDVQYIGQRPVDLLRRVQRLQSCHRSSFVETAGCTVRARSSKAIGLLKKLAMVETSAESYERETSLGVARTFATSGVRASGDSTAKASSLRDIRWASSA
ncbi:hypothetical protein IN07_01305 [Modestobacter caceresii]|uniref:Uncharacterized protein n=1 Tax=Modestobacter caceresii TaxID=1522368 RepID=A0A098YDW1_9ACTN|nr:hypothetical protein IN07_01305 [Modestobacter caceresii]